MAPWYKGAAVLATLQTSDPLLWEQTARQGQLWGAVMVSPALLFLWAVIPAADKTLDPFAASSEAGLSASGSTRSWFLPESCCHLTWGPWVQFSSSTIRF